MRIIAADPKDAAAADLIQTLDKENQIRYPGEPLFGIDEDGFVERGGTFLLGYVGGTAVACGALRPLDAGVFEVKRMYVRPEFRGRGLSRLMFNRLELIARDGGCNELRIETGRKQPEALGLYHSVGFAEMARFGPYVESEYSVCFSKHVLDSEELAFLREFEECSLSEPKWTHLAHVRVAWLYLTQYASPGALARIRAGIVRFNTEVLDRRQEYHETVTVAFARIISDRMMPGEAWAEYVQRIDDILNASSPILENYYSPERLGSVQARKEFVEADRRDLPMFRDTLVAHRFRNGRAEDQEE
jgi:GNAT superfamily N-acetyltransferase